MMINHNAKENEEFWDLFIKSHKYIALYCINGLIKLSLFIHDWQTIKPN